MRVHATSLRRWIGALLGLAALGLFGVGANPAPAAAAGTGPAFDHIFTIVMENHSYGQIIGSGSAPYINSLAAKYGLAKPDGYSQVFGPKPQTESEAQLVAAKQEALGGKRK